MLYSGFLILFFIQSVTSDESKWKKTSLSYSIENYIPAMTEAKTRNAVRDAFSVFSAVTPLIFRNVAPGEGDIKLSFVSGEHGCFQPFQGKDDLPAHAFFPPTGIVHFNADKKWTIMSADNTPEDHMDFLTVAMHEIGHALGLEHLSETDSLMSARHLLSQDSNGNYDAPKLAQSDIKAIQRLYGSAKAASRTKRSYCATTGQLRANSNPRKYEECVHGSWMMRDAPAGTEFSAATGGFVHATALRAKRSPCTSTGQLRANSNPRKYEECVYGSWMVRDAPPGTEFSAATGGFVHATGHSAPQSPAAAAPNHAPASSGFQFSQYDLEVLKKTIWLEARGESREGQIAVAHVIKNRARANQPGFGGSTVAGVCLKHMQFECWNNQKPADVQPNGEGYEEMDELIRGVLEGRIADNTHGALYYNNPDKEGYPGWTNNVNRGVKIGNHQFYTVRANNY